ncbi:kinesin family member 6, putative [Ichthyophthirius multifiliis]|uniref:Kinesin family member 6, putative n=1 Tax=Ichthyophthirius multifiliis TaxID=5932 RepID=G0QSS4_ICHMU|nr:kinesin family member 6, putative [Ichthyophthirius multifiliis]EGR31732.1 kinesin family member 6, putative [Ichthyophthirius multifiliis]|eukprot:XP_004035218.1 kinesin family member 6, putative [Ichthyophthirius multifiliis]
MQNNKAIEIYLRVRPTKKTYQGISKIKQINKLIIKNIDTFEEDNKIDFKILKDIQQGYVNNSKETYSFAFDKLLNQKSSQEKVFKSIAQEVCDSALQGFNGTIFAYGQTGSGKTFTMTGGPDSYEDRGIIPRTLSYIFQQTKKLDNYFFQISISYIEIYNNQGYDLLDENHSAKKIEDLKAVIPRETENEEIILSGLSIHKAINEEDALNLLYIGDVNRAVCETPKNDVSTRSHCIFTIMIESRKTDSDVKTMSRIHLVDLSGSERIKNTGIEGKLEKEARNINLSLHFLEHVIVCLNKRAQGENIHVPYRNSLMTLILRDSLGGNCKTKMISTISAEEPDILESISTCKFAQRVALVKNYVVKNEAVDPAVIIERLKRENAQLKAEINLLKGENVKDKLDADDIDICRQKVEEYINHSDPSFQLVLSDRLFINECFYQMKHKINNQLKQNNNPQNQIINKQSGLNENAQNTLKNVQYNHLEEEIKKLKLLVQQRDNEIMILLNLVNKNKGASISVPVYRENNEINLNENSLIRQNSPKKIDFPQFEQLQQSIIGNQQKYQKNVQPNNLESKTKENIQDVNTFHTQSILTQARQSLLQNNEVNEMLLAPLNLTNEQLMDRANCFEIFRKSYRKNQVMEENKNVLKEKFEKARQLGQQVNNARSKIDQMKNIIEDLRKERALKGLLEGENEDYKHPEEVNLLNNIEEQKKIYKENFNYLKDIKAEIENIQKLLQRNKDKMQQDFEKWLQVMTQQRQQMTLKNQSITSNILTNINNNTTTINNNNTSANTSMIQVSKINDKEVEKKLQAFYKARDEIYRN